MLVEIRAQRYSLKENKTRFDTTTNFQNAILRGVVDFPLRFVQRFIAFSALPAIEGRRSICTPFLPLSTPPLVPLVELLSELFADPLVFGERRLPSSINEVPPTPAPFECSLSMDIRWR